MSEPVNIAAIDAGSNAIRVAICAASSPSDINPLVKERVPVRLGHHTFVRGELDPQTLDQAVSAFGRFRKLFDQYGVTHYRAVSTSAVRNAKNRETLLHRLYHDTQIELEVLLHQFTAGEDSSFTAKYKEGLEHSNAALDAGREALDELAFRRRGLAVSLVIILLVLLGLGLKIRQLSAQQRVEPERSS